VLRFAKPFFFAVGALVLLVLLLFVGINLYLQSSAVQARIHQATAASLGLPVEMQGATFTPWGGLTLSKLSAADPARPETIIFQARQLKVRVALWPLLSRKVIITSISLKDPVTIIPEEGSLVLLPPTERVDIMLPEDPADTVAEAVTVEVPDAPSPTDQVKPASTRPSFTFEIQNFRIRNGVILRQDASGRPVASFSGVNIETRIQPDFSFKGKVLIEEISLQNQLFIRKVSGLFTREGGQVLLPKLTAELGKGELSVNAVVEEATGAFSMDGQLSHVQIPALLLEAGIPAGRAEGMLYGTVQVTGDGAPEALAGTGLFYLEEATLEPLDFIKQFGQLLSIEELQLLQLTKANLNLEFFDGQLLIREIIFQTSNLILYGVGEVNLPTRELDIDARLMINPSLQRSLGSLLGGSFVASEREGYRELPFRIYGPIDRPKTDLLDKIAGGRIGAEVGRFLQNLLSPPSRKKEE